MRCIASTVRPVPVTVTSMPPSIGFATASALSVTSLKIDLRPVGLGIRFQNANNLLDSAKGILARHRGRGGVRGLTARHHLLMHHLHLFVRHPVAYRLFRWSLLPLLLRQRNRARDHQSDQNNELYRSMKTHHCSPSSEISPHSLRRTMSLGGL